MLDRVVAGGNSEKREEKKQLADALDALTGETTQLIQTDSPK